MNSSFIAQFKTEKDFHNFTNWLRCFESDFKMQANAVIRFCRVEGCFAKVTLAPSSRYDDVFNAVGGFNGQAYLD